MKRTAQNTNHVEGYARYIYYRHCKDEQGAKIARIARQDLVSFVRFAKKYLLNPTTGETVRWSNMPSTGIIMYETWQAQQKRATVSILRRTLTLHHFYHWLQSEHPETELTDPTEIFYDSLSGERTMPLPDLKKGLKARKGTKLAKAS